MRKSSSLLLLGLAVACARVPSKSETDFLSHHAPASTLSVEQASPEGGPAGGTPEQASDEALNALLQEYAAERPAEKKEIADPIKPWNLVWFHFNDKLYFWFLKPVSKGYRVVLYPRFVRKGIRNFICNLGFPGRFFNNALQGRFKRTGSELGRFLVNTTIGVVGLWDPATRWLKMGRYDEDFDQTLGVWGMGMVFYLTWPLWGPSSLRGTLGTLGDGVLNPIVSWWPVLLLNRLNNLSLGLDPYEDILRMAVDPYTAVRDGYVQNRDEEIKK